MHHTLFYINYLSFSYSLRSAKKLLGSWLSEDTGNPLANFITSLLNLNRITIRWRIHLNAVATVVTIRGAGSLGTRVIYLSHCCPLPWIFDSISEESIRACIVKSTFTG